MEDSHQSQARRVFVACPADAAPTSGHAVYRHKGSENNTTLRVVLDLIAHKGVDGPEVAIQIPGRRQWLILIRGGFQAMSRKI
jgi:hypothetical protein